MTFLTGNDIGTDGIGIKSPDTLNDSVENGMHMDIVTILPVFSHSECDLHVELKVVECLSHCNYCV
jgi:hypothetical protein